MPTLTLREVYTDFVRIDLDTRGGYARVSEVKPNRQPEYPEYCAFKIMRHEIGYASGMERFVEELKLLISMTKDSTAPTAITKIYDSGFIPVVQSKLLQNREIPDGDLEIIRTGLEVDAFFKEKSRLESETPHQWLPYLVVERAPYDDSMLRQIRNQPSEDSAGLFRLPTGEVIMMAIQLLEVMRYLHEKHHRAYMDWKPEHIHWNGMDRHVKLIDWNITTPLDDSPGIRQNIRDDLRLFCGAVLYIGLTFIDPDDDPTKPIGPRPTKELDSPVPEIRRRYWTDNPNFFQREIALDEEIKEIVRKGLDPKQGYDSIDELRSTLISYGQNELGLTEDELTMRSQPRSPYFRALSDVHLAQRRLFEAQQNLYEAVRAKGTRAEFIRLNDAIKRALMNFPIS